MLFRSPVGSQILFIKKKDGSLRLCIDYRPLNSVTVKNRFAIPLIGETLDRLSKAKYFTSLDLRNGYHHIRIAEGEEWKTAFRTRYGHFEYLVMPFGLTNAPASFQNLINVAFKDHLDDFIVVYIDDILIYSNTLAEHKRHVRKALEIMKANNFYGRVDKCVFHKDSCDYLGFHVSADGVSMDPAKLKSITEWPEPSCVKDVQSFLGFLNFYRRFIANFSQLAAPLVALTRKDSAFDMTGAPLEAFQLLKDAFTTADIVRHYQPGVHIVLETDSSDFAIGAVLSQRFADDGKLHPIAFHSRKLTDSELNYEIYDKELLSTVEAFKHWRCYLEGVSEATDVFVDHKNLEHFFGAKVLNRRQARWYELMVGFNFILKHRPGTQQGRSDALSRRPDYAIGSKASEAPPVQFFGPSKTLASVALSYDELPESFSPVRFFAMAVIAPIRMTEPFPDLHDHLAAAQDADDDLKQVLQDLRLKENLANHDSRWTLDADGLLRWDGKVYVGNDAAIWLRVVREIHDVGTAGHPEITTTIDNFCRAYYFPQYRTYLTSYVNQCDPCHRDKSRRQKQHGFLQPLPVAKGPWKSISMDFIIKLPRSIQRNDSILAVIDRFTKRAYFIPCREAGMTSPDVAELYLRNIFANHGIPDDIVSDRGSVFDADFWRTLQALLHTKINMSTAFHPQSDGQTERLNQAIEQFIRIYCNYQQDDWELLLPLAQFVYNSTYHSAIKRSPFEATYGYNPQYTAYQKTSTTLTDAHAHDFASYMSDMHQILRQELARAAARMAKGYDARVAEAPTFKIGDKVWLSSRNIITKRKARKLDHKYLGPLVVAARVGTLAYRLALPPQMEIHPVFHVALLFPYVSNTFEGREEPVPPITIVNGEPELEVSEVLDSRTWHGALQYRLSWVGQDASENSWEDADDVHADALVKAFHLRYPAKPSEPATRQSGRLKGRIG